MNLEFFQTFWFILVGLALFLWTFLDGFDLGAGMLAPFRKTSLARDLTIHSFWPVWDGNALWGLTAGGALFAVFPMVFERILSGLYPYVMILMVALIFRPIALELWHHTHHSDFWVRILGVVSGATLVLAGTVVGNTIVGFGVDETGRLIGGLFSILSPYALLTGVLLVSLSLLHGTYWLKVKLPPESQVAQRPQKLIWGATILLSLVWILWTGFTYVDRNQSFYWVTSGLFIVSLGINPWLKSSKESSGLREFWFSGLGWGLFWLSVAFLQFPRLVRFPGLGGDLTIAQSAPEATLQFLGIAGPVVILGITAYTIYVYRVFKGRLDSKSISLY